MRITIEINQAGKTHSSENKASGLQFLKYETQKNSDFF